MSSYEIDAIYELLLKRYEKKGFLRPEAALESGIHSLVTKGRTREEAIRELYSSESPWTYSPTMLSIVGRQEKGNEQNAEVLGQVAKLREKIDSLTTLFSKGEITEETYVRGVRKIEDDINTLQQEHGIPKVEHKRTLMNISGTAGRKTIEEVEETKYRHGADSAWYLVPFFFGILGGIVAYVGVKDDDPDMADNLLIFGILWTFALIVLGWIVFLH